MTPSTSSSGPGRGPGRSSSGRTSAGRGATPRRKPAPPKSGKTSTGRGKTNSSQTSSSKKPKPEPAARRSPPTGRKAPAKKVTASRSAGLLERPPARPRRPVVSPTSAKRFAARARARRLRRTLSVLGAVVVLTGGGWLAFLSPWSRVDRVTVSGLDRVSQAQVHELTDGEIGQAMLLARTDAIAAQIEELRLVKSVSVTRSWPGTIKVEVTERQPVAALPSTTAADSKTGSKTGGTTTDTVRMVQLVDEDGVVIETVPEDDAPAELPLIQVTLGESNSVENLRATLTVLNGLPEKLSSRLSSVGTSSPDGIWLRLRKNRSSTVLVRWGDAEQGAAKAKVLTALLKQKAKVYDVRAPEMPSISS